MRVVDASISSGVPMQNQVADVGTIKAAWHMYRAGLHAVIVHTHAEWPTCLQSDPIYR